jgi:hypothetical protein
MQPEPTLNRATFPAGGAGYKLPFALYDDELYVCVKCGLRDAPIYAGEADPDAGVARFIHRVTLDVVFTKSEVLSSRDKAEGFLMMKLENRPAKVRAICRDCLEADEQTQAVWKDFDRARREMDEQTKEPSWCAVLCQE